MDAAPTAAPEVERLVEEGRAADHQRLAGRELAAELTVGVPALVAALAFALLGPDELSGLPWLEAVVLTVSYAIAGRVRFEVGLGATDLSLLVLVPMLFELPPQVVPLAIVAGDLLGTLPDVVGGRVHRDRLVKALPNAWYAFGPAVVLAYGVDGGPRWGDWPSYVAAFAAMVVCDAISGLAREGLSDRVAPQVQIRVLALVYALDAMLAPVGLLAALATEQEAYAFLLLAPLVLVLLAFAREREQRLTQALELAETRAAAAEARAEVLGAVSHGLQTPLAVVVGLADVLHRAPPSPEQGGASPITGRLRSEAHWLRHQIAQTLDYQRVHAGHALGLRTERVDVVAQARAVAALPQDPPGVDVVAAGDAGELMAAADTRRVAQVLTSLVDNARRASPPDARVVVAVSRADGMVHAEVRDTGPGIAPEVRERLFADPTGARGTDESQGTGISLYVSRALAEAMGGTLECDRTAAGETAFTLALPAA
ncbi:sensor histidine kinase KdpD [Conexibacter sp. SYSU D00693]|uniref:sensor histidine kinase n=1 Tax=Conexibacter sp. SYSU D00693 TaxID=2812560 RepID=UPI00196B3F6B|nr:HAMP domain-containing sensor histidine kinase [Conexibacter sp. SYSU D00693]